LIFLSQGTKKKKTLSASRSIIFLFQGTKKTLSEIENEEKEIERKIILHT
jgi:hypothetical protein